MNQRDVPDTQPEGKGSNRRGWQDVPKRSAAGSPSREEPRNAQARDADRENDHEGKGDASRGNDDQPLEADSYSAAAERRFNESVEAMVQSGRADANDVDAYDGSIESEHPRRDD